MLASLQKALSELRHFIESAHTDPLRWCVLSADETRPTPNVAQAVRDIAYQSLTLVT